MKKFIAWLLAGALLFSLAACAGANQEPAGSAGARGETPSGGEITANAEDTDGSDAQTGLKIVLVTDAGGIGDESVNALAWEGCQEAQNELGVAVEYIESRQESDYAPNLELAYEAGAGLILGIGQSMRETMEQAASKNPDKLFVVIDASYDETTMPSNLIGITFQEQQPAFIAGYVAAKTSKTSKVGFVGGAESEAAYRFQYGYYTGVKYANVDCEVVEQYTDSDQDSTMGKAIAQKMYQSGADVVFHAAGAAGTGVIEAAKETGSAASGGEWVIGSAQDQYALAPDNMLLSVQKHVDGVVSVVAREYAAGTLKGGVNRVYGYEQDSVGFASTGDHVDAQILLEADELAAKIKSGEVVPPGTKDECDAFIVSLG